MEHKGKVIDNSGDELYVVFGLDNSVKEAADEAIATGQAILAELDRLNRDYLVKYYQREFEVGIGIHAGKVITGDFTINGQSKSSVMGLAVNIASRIQDATKEFNNSLIVSDEVARHSSLEMLSPFQSVSLKGSRNRHDIHLLGKSYHSRS